MRLSDREYWIHGPASIRLLLKRKRENEKLPKLSAGLIASAVYNVNLKEDAQRLMPSSFFPELKTKQKDDEPDVDLMIENFKAVTARGK